MITKAELNCYIIWSYTPNCSKEKCDIIDEIYTKVKDHIVGVFFYSCGVEDSPAYPYYEYCLIIDDASAVLKSCHNNKTRVLCDYTKRPSWCPAVLEDKDVLPTHEEVTVDGLYDRLLFYIRKAKKKQKEGVPFKKKDKEVSCVINNVKFVASLDDSLSFLLSVMQKNGRKVCSRLYEDFDSDSFLASSMTAWVLKHAGTKLEGSFCPKIDNVSVNQLLRKMLKNINTNKASYQFHKLIWSEFGDYLVRFALPEDEYGWYLSVIKLKEECRGQGIGSAIMEKMCRQADMDCKFVYLSLTKIDDIPSYKTKYFFRKFQFEEIGYMNFDRGLPLMVRKPQPLTAITKQNYVVKHKRMQRANQMLMKSLQDSGVEKRRTDG